MNTLVKTNFDSIKFQTAEKQLNSMGFEIDINCYGASITLDGEALKLWFTSADQLEGFAAGVAHERERNKKDEE